MSYAVKEIYYTLQGEGANTGRAAVHMIGAGVSSIDVSGRYPNEATGCRIYLTPEFWV
jgi:hypothetical protein